MLQVPDMQVQLQLQVHGNAIKLQLSTYESYEALKLTLCRQDNTNKTSNTFNLTCITS